MPKPSRGGIKGGTTAIITPRIRLMRKLDRSGFKYNGNGEWNLNVPGLGGAQILDETGSSAALRMGLMPDQKLYSMIYWGEQGGASERQYYDRINDAKYYAKSALAVIDPIRGV